MENIDRITSEKLKGKGLEEVARKIGLAWMAKEIGWLKGMSEGLHKVADKRSVINIDFKVGPQSEEDIKKITDQVEEALSSLLIKG